MLNRNAIKVLILLCLFLLLSFAIGFFLYMEKQYCMGVPLISESDIQQYDNVSSLDVSYLRMNNEEVAIDIAQNTIYISQSSNMLSHYSLLQGTLETTNPSQSLFFVNNAVLEDVSSAVCNGTPLSLLILERESYMLVNVVITTLPVLNIEGVITPHQNENGRDIYSGKVTFWSGNDPFAESYSTKSSSLQWHIRGASSSVLPKKPYKLSLKDSDGNNTDENFLGLGEEDDWILNPMNIDDTKVREKFAMDFWNQYLSQNQAQNRMSNGEYVEVVINKEYQGLYLLQRRVDNKYLKIDRNQDILMKGRNLWTPASLGEGYGIVYSPYNLEETYQFLELVLSSDNQNVIDNTEFIKTEVFINFISAPDNSGYKNMFYLLQKEEDHFEMSFIPWDTDMSMGIIWTDKFVYDYTVSVQQNVKRQEHNFMLQNQPELNDTIAKYWIEMREHIYTEENIQILLNENIATISNSGAYLRDLQKWGTRYGGADTHEALRAWCKERLDIMDSLYDN